MLLIWSSEDVGGLVRTLGLKGVAVGTSASPPNPDEANVMLCMGAKPVNKLIEAGVFPKNRTVGSLRNKPFEAEIWGRKMTIFATYSPSIFNRDYGCYVDMLCDLRFIHRYAMTGQMYPEKGDYTYVKDFKQSVAEMKKVIARDGRCEAAIDLETRGLDPYFKGGLTHAGKGSKMVEAPEGFIITIQLTYKVGKSEVVYFHNKAEGMLWIKQNREDLMWILNEQKVTVNGANFKYDLHWLYRHFGLTCSNFRFDTTLVGNMLDENRSNGLEVHTKIYAPEIGGYSDTFDSTVDKSRMDLVDKQRILDYGGGDTDATLRVKLAMKKELLLPENKSMARFYVNILHPSARAFEKVEQGGVHVDIDRFNTLEGELKVAIGHSIESAKSVLGGRIVAKHSDAGKEFGINITKASLITDFMFSPMGLNLKPRMRTPTGGASTALEHVEMFSDVPEAVPFIEAMKEYQSASKTLSTYVVGFRKHLRSDGRLHPTYWFFSGDKARGDGGTVTGRLSARDPAFQTLPKHTFWGKKLRSCYTAPEGYVVGEFDYSQGELKVVACVANEEAMIEAYAQGKDLHTVTAAGMLGMTYEQLLEMKKTDYDTFSTYRQYGKPCNFGLLYSMSANGLREYARVSYGVVFSETQASDFREAFFETYPRLPEYHARYKEFARRNGFVESPLGRRRHLPLIKSMFSDIKAGAERQAVNSPIQSTLSDMLCWAVALGEESGFLDICPSFGAIHDATYNYIPEDRVDECVKTQLHIMENLPFHKVGWVPQLQFTADAKIGPSMGELEEYEG